MTVVGCFAYVTREMPLSIKPDQTHTVLLAAKADLKFKLKCLVNGDLHTVTMSR